MTDDLSDECRRIVRYLADVHRANPQAEVSIQELAFELRIDSEAARACIEQLAHEGLAEADLFPTNVWVRLTDKGVTVAAGLNP